MLSDRDTGLCLALPTLQKGGKSLSYLVTEMCRFIVRCGHSEVGLRCDGGPSTLALLEAVQRACMGLNIVVHPERAPTGDHQANGAALRIPRALLFVLGVYKLHSCLQHSMPLLLGTCFNSFKGRCCKRPERIAYSFFERASDATPSALAVYDTGTNIQVILNMFEVCFKSRFSVN